MASGSVKWYDATKGYGFISADDGGHEVFVHNDNLQQSGLSGLEENQRIEYETVPGEKGLHAENIRLV